MSTVKYHIPRRPVRATSGSPERRRGAIAVLAAIMLVIVLGMAAFAIDVGYLCLVRTELQRAADAAAHAAAYELPDRNQAIAVAKQYAELNYSPNSSTPGNAMNKGNGKTAAADSILVDSDVVLGTWNPESRTFTQTIFADEANAVQATVRRSQSGGNPLWLFFGQILGRNTANVEATAIAMRPTSDDGTRFLIDNEMFDTDIPAIQDLAAAMGVTPDDLLSDGNDDWFIDLPPGAVLELPTGQVGDVALWDREHPAFPFGKPGKPSLKEFLNYNEDGSCRDRPEVKELLDPLTGVSAADDADIYPTYVDPDYVHVSPVYKSDISALNPVYPEDIPTEYGVPAVNALGLRRGLVAFKIIALGTDPDGPTGSVLPNLVIEVVNPNSVTVGNEGTAIRPVLVY